jgi:hypothetical protein
VLNPVVVLREQIERETPAEAAERLLSFGDDEEETSEAERSVYRFVVGPFRCEADAVRWAKRDATVSFPSAREKDAGTPALFESYEQYEYRAVWTGVYGDGGLVDEEGEAVRQEALNRGYPIYLASRLTSPSDYRKLRKQLEAWHAEEGARP